MEREVLRKKNRERYNEFLLQLNELRYNTQIGDIQTLAYKKLMEFIDYCESRGVYYFIELPISDIINMSIFKMVESSKKLDERVENILKKCNKRSPFSPIRILDSIEANMVRSSYFDLYSELSGWDFHSVYRNCYMIYYKQLLNNNITEEELESQFASDYELSIRLNMGEQFLIVKNSIKKNKCKINVQGNK